MLSTLVRGPQAVRGLVGAAAEAVAARVSSEIAAYMPQAQQHGLKQEADATQQLRPSFSLHSWQRLKVSDMDL